MAIKNPRSDTPGKRPNLVPGQLALNRADDRLFFRYDGKVRGIDLEDLRTRTAPGGGPEGAPLVMTDGQLTWDTSLVPSSVVDGRVDVDFPTEDVYGVPGFIPTEVSNLVLGEDDVRAERFYVASDSIRVRRMAFNALGMGFTSARMGIARLNGTVLVDEIVLAPAAGANEVEVDVTLARGEYQVLFWSAGSLTVTEVFGFRSCQGFDLVAGDPVFTQAQEGSADLSAALVVPSLSPVDAAVPGERKVVMLGWTT